MDLEKKELPEVLPVLPVKDAVIFPRMVVPLMVRDKESQKIVNDVLEKDKLLVITLSKEGDKKDKNASEIFRIGTAVHVMKLSKGDEGTMLVVQGVARVEILEFLSKKPYRKAKVLRLEDMPHAGQLSPAASRVKRCARVCRCNDTRCIWFRPCICNPGIWSWRP